MEIINVYEKSINNWTIRPGPVGSVGDTHMQVRLRQTGPDSHTRYDKDFSGKEEKFYGSNVQDGQFGSGGSARVIDRKFGSRPGHKTSVGWRFQDLIPTDRSSMTTLKHMGPFTWDNQRASVLRAKVSGEKFMPSPLGYDKTLLRETQSLARGNQVPRVVLTESGSQPIASVPGSIVNPNAVSPPEPVDPYTTGYRLGERPGNKFGVNKF